MSREIAEANAALIVKAINEYEALSAIAEAAERFIDGVSDGENTIRSTLKALKDLRS